MTTLFKVIKHLCLPAHTVTYVHLVDLQFHIEFSNQMHVKLTDIYQIWMPKNKGCWIAAHLIGRIPKFAHISSCKRHRRQSWGVRDPHILGWGVVGKCRGVVGGHERVSENTRPTAYFAEKVC